MSRICRLWNLLKLKSENDHKVAIEKSENRAVQLIKHFESCLEPIKGGFAAYPDPYHGWDVPTIGWGTTHYPTGKRVRRGDTITPSRADELLAWEVKDKREAVRSFVTVPIARFQEDALVSFAYNVGKNAFRHSTLLKKINNEDFDAAALEFTKWRFAGGQESDGLLRRRISEQNLFRGKNEFIVSYEEFKAMTR